jgi:hypothetical protein
VAAVKSIRNVAVQINRCAIRKEQTGIGVELLSGWLRMTSKTLRSYLTRNVSLPETVGEDDINYLGFLFESLATRDLRIYAQTLDGDIFHYHDKSDLEADLIIRLHYGRWAPVLYYCLSNSKRR